MRSTTLFKRLLISLAVLCSPVFGQTIDPTNQINWAVGPIPSFQTKYVNGAVQVAGWTGSDACAKLHGAMQYAIANSKPIVDATGLIGTQPCASNPFLNLTTGSANIGTAVNITVLFGTTHYTLATPWVIVNSGITLRGAGPFATVLEYTGGSAAYAVDLNTDSGTGVPAEQGGPNGISISDMYIYGDTNLTDAIDINSSRSKFDNIHAWGATNCGIHVFGGVSNTYIHPVVSSVDATLFGIDNSGHTIPNNGLCLDQDTTFGTVACTASTIVDPIMEGLNAIGLDFISANNITVTGGTSELNGTNGIKIAAASGVINKQNTFIGIDLEGNGTDGSTNGYDVDDLGDLNTYINILATSHCNATCHSVYLPSGSSGWIQGGNIGDGVNNVGSSGGGVNGFINPGGKYTGTCTNVGAMTMEVQGTLIYVPYCTTHP